VVWSATVTQEALFTVDAVDAETCRWVQRAMNAGSSGPAAVLTEHFDVDEQERRATEIDVPDDVLARVESCLDAQRDRISAFYGCPLSSREGAGFLRYGAGSFYGPHVDRANVPSWPAAAGREITIVLFLNSSRDVDPAGEFTGGRLRIFPDGLDAHAIDVVPTRGMLVAFPASMPHEVTPVERGTRDAVVDWFY
jgi:predicted 2-oxoglutarate/Fe(II)-dependent dioxygenase YbiX